jgi:hypothetical protein
VVPNECDCEVPVNGRKSEATQLYLELLEKLRDACGRVVCLDLQILCLPAEDIFCESQGSSVGRCTSGPQIPPGEGRGK